MTSIIESISVVLLAFGCVAPDCSFAQSSNPKPEANTILEVIATHTTMASEHSYVYLRVFPDGTAEFQSSRDSHSESNVAPVVSRTLNEDDFTRLKSAVSQPRLAALKLRYETRFAIIDTSTEWTVRIYGSGRAQTVQVLEFSPGLARIMKHPYPEALVKLGCTIEKLRADVSGESERHDRECSRVIGTRKRPDLE
jgi:hypothetical protein